jgi:hypothetical protein
LDIRIRRKHFTGFGDYLVSKADHSGHNQTSSLTTGPGQALVHY